LAPQESKIPKEPKQRKDRKKKLAKKDKEGRESKKIPSDATVHTLAKAIWTEIKLHADGGKEKKSAEQRSELWENDKKEYVKLARKVVNRLGRRADKNKNRGEGRAKRIERGGVEA